MILGLGASRDRMRHVLLGDTPEVQAHGTGFSESLEKTPLPSHVPVFPNAPEEDEQPCTIWNWVMWRLDSLERADTRLLKLLNKCEDLADQVMRYSAVTREVSIKPALHKRKETINMKLDPSTLEDFCLNVCPQID